jgi:dehydrogenase/reductase SDR family member 12
MVSTYCVAKGAKLYMICRDSTRGEQAKQDIIQQTQCTTPDNIKIVLADVGELHQVRKAASEIQQSESSIHALVCNAGVLLNTKQVTSENNEITFACHLLGGTYLLTNLLLPQLKNSNGNGRVVVVTSGGMYNTPIPSWDIMTTTSATTKYDGTMAYAYAKRGQVVLAEQWSKQYADIKFVTVHPGWTDTPAVEEAFGDNKKYLAPLREPWQGAEGVAWLVGTKTENIKNGELYLDRLVQKKHISGPFMAEGSYTKNTPDEIKQFLSNLKQAAGIE